MSNWGRNYNFVQHFICRGDGRGTVEVFHKNAFPTVLLEASFIKKKSKKEDNMEKGPTIFKLVTFSRELNMTAS